jgi:hypothetical protein
MAGGAGERNIGSFNYENNRTINSNNDSSIRIEEVEDEDEEEDSYGTARYR